MPPLLAYLPGPPDTVIKAKICMVLVRKLVAVRGLRGKNSYIVAYIVKLFISPQFTTLKWYTYVPVELCSGVTGVVQNSNKACHRNAHTQVQRGCA